MKSLPAIAILCCLVNLGHADPADREVDDAQIHLWVKDLTNSSFRSREHATLQLIQYARLAAGSVAEAMDGTSPEVTWRGFEILVAASVTDDDDTSEAAFAALHQLSRSSQHEIASVANRSLAGWHTKRRQIMLNKVKALGAKVSFDGTAAPVSGSDTVFLSLSGAVVPPVIPSPTTVPSTTTPDEPDARMVKAFEAALDAQARLSLDEAAIVDEMLQLAPREASSKTKAEKSADLKSRALSDLQSEFELGLRAVLRPLGIRAESSPASELRATAISELVTPISIDAYGGLAATEVSMESLEAGAIALTIDQDWTGGDDGLELVVQLGNVRSLNLRESTLTYQAVKYIAQMNQLQSVNIHEGTIDGAAFRALRTVRPELYVFATGTGYLGVNGSDDAAGFRVTGVTSGGCAATAGVLEGDIITALNKVPIKDLSSVSLCVFNRKPGYPVRIELLRNGEPMVLEGALGKNPNF